MTNQSPSTTSLVWQIDSQHKKVWLRKNKKDTRLVDKFYKFEKSVTINPFSSNRDVKKLKGTLSDTLEYKKPPVRGLYQLDKNRTLIKLVEFDWKGNISYR